MIPALTVGDLVRWPMWCVFPDHCISKAVGGIRGPQLAQTASNCYPGREVKNPSFFYGFLRVKDGFSTGKRRVTESGVMIFIIERRVFYGWNTGFHTRKTGIVPKTLSFFQKKSPKVMNLIKSLQFTIVDLWSWFCPKNWSSIHLTIYICNITVKAMVLESSASSLQGLEWSGDMICMVNGKHIIYINKSII